MPKKFRFEGDEVIVKRVGDAVLLFPKQYRATTTKDALDELDPEFHLDRDQPREPQRRDSVG